MKNNLARAKMALPNGYCALPLQQSREHAKACLTCPMFVTTSEFLPQHRGQLEQIRALIDHTEQQGQHRVVEMNRTVEKNLLAIIGTLTEPGLRRRMLRLPLHRRPNRRKLLPPMQTARLGRAAQARHQQTVQRAHTALDTMAEGGDPVTVAGLATRAGISRSWRYIQLELLASVEQLCCDRGRANNNQDRPRQPGEHGVASGTYPARIRWPETSVVAAHCWPGSIVFA